MWPQWCQIQLRILSACLLPNACNTTHLNSWRYGVCLFVFWHSVLKIAIKCATLFFLNKFSYAIGVAFRNASLWWLRMVRSGWDRTLVVLCCCTSKATRHVMLRLLLVSLRWIVVHLTQLPGWRIVSCRFLWLHVQYFCRCLPCYTTLDFIKIGAEQVKTISVPYLVTRTVVSD